MNAKTKKSLLSVMLGVSLMTAAGTPAMAATTESTINKGTDLLINRPAAFGATVIGSAVWLGTLPLTLASGIDAKTSADVLVKEPFDSTFKQPLGMTSQLPADWAHHQDPHGNNPGKPY